MTQQFRVVISGRTLSGAPLAAIQAEVGRVFRLQGEQLERMLCGKPVVVSRQASAAAAEKLRARLQELDLEARCEPLAEIVVPPAVVVPPPTAAGGSDELFALAAPVVVSSPATPAPGAADSGLSLLPSAPAAEMICPKCGEAQPKRTLCRQCGLDMPRFLEAQAAAENEARAARASPPANRSPAPAGRSRPTAESGAGILGLGFSGRLGGLDYFAASLLGSVLWLLLVWLAAVSGKMAFAGFGLFLSAVYAIRCIALRLHDTGRTGWLALVALVPVLGALMAFVLLFIHGEDEANEYGPPPAEGGGRRALLALLAVLVVGGLSFRSFSQNPEKAARFVAAMSAGQGPAAVADDAETENVDAPGSGRYASTNRIDIYLMAGCTECDNMRSWLNANGLHYTVYAVDRDQSAAERLHSIIAGSGAGDARVQLPVLEINGQVLPGNPDLGAVHRALRQAAP
ncbi:MAG: hypothetical protein H6R15_1295 [Proteobacteria bacterium]|nr:hypothetical protein [Pseudomonadota bacterium]